MTANPLRGEVDLEIHGEKYVLRRSYGGMARLQAAVGVEGLGALLGLLRAGDMRVMGYGVPCLAVSGDTSKWLDFDPFQPPDAVGTLAGALSRVIMGSSEKNADGAKAEESPNPDSSPRANT